MYDTFQIVCRFGYCCYSDEVSRSDDIYGHCYYLTPSLPFSDAVSLSRTRNSNMAEITTQQIKDDLKLLMKSGPSIIWIGGTSRRWVWKQHDTSHDDGILYTVKLSLFQELIYIGPC